MPATTGPSHFADVSNVLYGTINIWSVSNIRINRQKGILKGYDNNKLRPVSTHMISVAETVSFETNDVQALVYLEDATGAQSLVFDWIASSQQLTTSPLATQLVTISNCVITNINTDAMTKGLGKATVTMEVLEVTAGTDPIVFAVASSPPTVGTD